MAMEPEIWHILHEPIYWLLAASSIATAATPAFLRSISKTKAVTIALFWTSLCGITLIMFGLIPGLATVIFSLLIGLLLFAASLVMSGIKSMPNQRFEDRKP